MINNKGLIILLLLITGIPSLLLGIGLIILTINKYNPNYIPGCAPVCGSECVLTIYLIFFIPFTILLFIYSKGGENNNTTPDDHQNK